MTHGLLSPAAHTYYIILQRHRAAKAAQYHNAVLGLVQADLGKEAAAPAGQVVEVDAALILPALNQVRALIEDVG